MSRHSSQHSPAHLVELDGFEQRLEVAFAETLVALALDDLEEDRADDVVREDLQQQALALLRIAVEQDATLAQIFQVLAMPADARIHAIVICIGRVLERHALPAQLIHRADDVLRTERDVLNAFATIRVQVFLDLRLVVLRLVDRDADLAARAGHRAAEQAALLAFDVEITDLAEVEQLLVEAGPLVHVAARDVVRQMIDVRQSGVARAAAVFYGDEVDVVDRTFAVAVDQVHETAADAFDRRDLQFHRSDARLHRLR